MSQLAVASNAISDMIQNDDFCTMSQLAVVSNAIDVDNDVELNEVLEDDSGDEDNEDEHTQGQETPHVHTGEVPSTFTSMEGTNMTSDGDWIVSQSTSKNDFTRELGKDSFKDWIVSQSTSKNDVTRLQITVLHGHPSSIRFLMKHIGHNHRLMNCFQIRNNYGIKKVVPGQQDYEMAWTLKKEEILIFVEFVSKRVIIENDVRPNQDRRFATWSS